MNVYKYLRINNKTTREHRVIMEKELGRKLTKNEVVHHKNGIKNDNNINNLELTNHSQHAKNHVPKAPRNTIICPICKKSFLVRKKYLDFKKKIGQKTICCSKICRGKQNSGKRWNKTNPGICIYKKIIEQGLNDGLTGYKIAKKYKINNKTVYNYINKLKAP